MVKCGCGETAALSASTTTCGECGADHKAAVREGLTGEWLGGRGGAPLALLAHLQEQWFTLLGRVELFTELCRMDVFWETS